MAYEPPCLWPLSDCSLQKTGLLRLKIWNMGRNRGREGKNGPAATSLDYPTQFVSVTHGKGSMSTSFHGYRECPDEPAKTMPRRGVDPLDTAKYILAARSALDGDIF